LATAQQVAVTDPEVAKDYSVELAPTLTPSQLREDVAGQRGQKFPPLGFINEQLHDTGVQAGIIIAGR
jgi:hypothetical protein